MLDIKRLERNHVLTVRGKDDKFVVVVTNKDGNDIWEITWTEWVRLGVAALKD